MGYISSGATSSTTIAYLTQVGRELLLKGDKANFKIKYFALGDSDTNYLIKDYLVPGYVPDVTGDKADCLKSVTRNIDIKNKINLD